MGTRAYDSRAPVSRASEISRSVSVFMVIMVACASLHTLLDSVGWWFELAAVCIFVIGGGALTRSLTRRRFAASLVPVLVLVAFIVARFASDTTIFGIFPGEATLGRLTDLCEAAVISIREQAIPATVDTGILLLLVLGVGVIAFTVDLTVSTLHTPAFAGIPLLILLAVPGMTDFDLSDGFLFVLTAAGYLWLLQIGKQHRRIRLSVSFGAVAIVGALLVAVALPPGVTIGGGGGVLVKTGLNPALELGNDLRSTSSTAALIYTTTAKKPPYLRLVTLEKFSGRAWLPDAPRQEQRNDVASFSAPPGLSARVATTVIRSTITVSNFASPWLPVPYPTSSITGLSGDWYWEPGSLAVSSPNGSVDGQDYTVKSVDINPTPRQLSAAGSSVPAGLAKYLSLPSDLPTIIPDVARQVTAGEPSNYTRALALQEYFRGAEFTYSEQAPVNDGYDGTGMAVIAKFLEVKSGYCIHFASAMAVMARSLGIPSRVAVGFQPGTVTGTDSQGFAIRTVTSHDFHAWPELYFDGIGWVPFEPTPGRGVVPSYADLTEADVPLPISRPQQPQFETSSPSPAPAQTQGRELPGDQGGQQQGASSVSAVWPWAASLLGLLALLLLLPMAVREAAKERRLRFSTAVGAWRELLATAEDLGLNLPDTLTPREVANLLASAAGGESLDRLRIALERESYAVSGAPGVDHADLKKVVSRLRAGVPWRDRMTARFIPRSVWSRVFRRMD
ncbi:MAG: DUF3488 and transglutaminase-like domain-containing protein [Lacisediminihabitans sp.]